MDDHKGITLIRHIMAKKPVTMPTVELALIMERIAMIGKRISRWLAVSSLGGALGYTGATNVQGEKVKKLDEWANGVFLEEFERGYLICSLISEEMEDPHHYNSNCRESNYCLLYDPIDGSSNTDVNGGLGTIFAVRRRTPKHGKGASDVLAPGSAQVAAGYIVYGPSTQLVYTAGDGVDIFTLDHSVGEFILWRENVKMPPHGSVYAVNQGNAGKWHEGARKFVAHITSRKNKRTSYSLRYSGAFASDFHRCLLEGGLYMYPGEVTEGGALKGKLRLLYEEAPLSMVAEQAGGRGSNGKGRILDLTPQTLHDRYPIYIGSAEEIKLAEEFKVEG
ncbi:MAG TPA: class 1 fructose-bisphosphatase [Candidatus Binataceae bacterium]|nr:class 1 fructose-bisphosphatase [Candidatus Binataceae bacterium]